MIDKYITNKISKIFGKFASKKFPKYIQIFINKIYVKGMGLDMSEFNSLSSYKSLNQLFTRSLTVKRNFNLDKLVMISPCDSWISVCDNLKEYEALQIKGMSYSVKDFLTNHISSGANKLIKNASYINFYLSPKDYHRFHAPIDMKIHKAIHVCGRLRPVNVASLKKYFNLFIENERVILECEHKEKIFFLVLIGALNVGKIVVNFEPKISTNTQINSTKLFEYSNLSLKKGDELGYFKMGSTIVIIAQKDMLDIVIKQGDNIKFGQTIAYVK